jgi:hypothetical protein
VRSESDIKWFQLPLDRSYMRSTRNSPQHHLY